MGAVPQDFHQPEMGVRSNDRGLGSTNMPDESRPSEQVVNQKLLAQSWSGRSRAWPATQSCLMLPASDIPEASFIDNLPGGVYRCRPDFDWTMQYISAGIEALSGYPAADFINNRVRSFRSIIHPDDRATVDAVVQAAIADRHAYRLEYRLLHADGSSIWVYERGQGWWDSQGQLQYLDGILLDIRDRKHSETTLVHANQQLQAFMENAPSQVALFDETGRYLKVNQAAADLFQRPKTAIEGRSFTDLFPREVADKFMGRVQQIVQTWEPQAVQDRLQFAGKDYVFRTILFPVTVESDAPMVLGSIATDITPMIEAQASLWRQAERERLVRTITENIRRSLDLTEILNTAVTEVRQLLQTDRVLIFRFNPDWSGDMVVESVAESWKAVLGETVVDTCFQRGNLAQQYRQGRVGQIEDVENAAITTCHKDLLTRFQVRANVTLPLNCGGQLWGLLCIHQCRGARRWQTEEIAFLQQICNQLAIAIQQAELYQKAQTELVERTRLEAQLRHEARHDALTGLPNRTFFLERLEFALQRFQRRCGSYRAWNADSELLASGDARRLDQFAVLFLDLNRFKVINDSLGHAAGDQLLKIVAQRLTQCVREIDTPARLGGDEFVVLVEEIGHVSDAIEVARRIHDALEAPILLGDHEVFVKASIGLALASPHYGDANQILRDADIAMYQAKDGDREYAVFDAPMHTVALELMQLENDLRRAIERQEFRLHYQPIVSLKTQQLQGFEVLIRWQHPSRGLVSPAEFIPLAEETGLITDIDLWVLQGACRQLQIWQQQFPDLGDLTLNVNLSGKQFVRTDLIAQIDRTLAETGLDGRALKLELTESVLIQNAQLSINILEQLQQRHIGICIDDFGTGYSSLSYLHRFPVNVLKIDKSFVANLCQRQSNLGDHEIVKAIVNLALNLKLGVVAEGITTLEQMLFLQSNGCASGQGYYFSRPLDDAAATDLLSRQSHRQAG